MPRLTVLQGLPGSGKSTYADQLVVETQAQVVSTDDIRRRILPEKKARDALAFGMAYAQATQHLMHGEDVVVDATNTTLDAVSTWRGIAEATGAEFKIVRMPTSLADCMERNCRRTESVPRHVLLRMAMQLAIYDEAQP